MKIPDMNEKNTRAFLDPPTPLSGVWILKIQMAEPRWHYCLRECTRIR